MGIGSASLQGYDSYLGVAKEVTFGTRVTATSFFEYTSEGFNRVDEEIKPEVIVGHRDFTRRLRGNTVVSGAIECPLNPAEDSNILLIANAMGGAISTTILLTGSAYKHVINTGDIVTEGSVKSLSFTKRLGTTIQYSYAGMRVNSMTIKGENGAVVSMSAELAGKLASGTSDSLTSVIVDVNPVNFPDVSFYLADTTTSLQTTTALQTIQNFELTLNNNLISDGAARSLGSRDLDVLPPGRFEVSLKATQRFDTTTAIDRSRLDTGYSIGILLDTGQTIGAAGSSTYSMYFEIPRAFYSVPEPGVGDMGILSQEIEFSTVRNTTTNQTITIQANNATASY